MSRLHRYRTERTKGTPGVRQRILDQFELQLATLGFAALRLNNVATDCKVSRQTIHKDFGDKCGLAHALAVRVLNRFVDECIAEFRLHGSVYYAVYHATVRALKVAEDTTVISAALKRPDDKVVRMMAINVEPILRHCRARLADAAVEHWPDLDPQDIETAVYIIVGYVHEQILQRSGSIEDAARWLARVIGGFAENSRRLAAERRRSQDSYTPATRPDLRSDLGYRSTT